MLVNPQILWFSTILLHLGMGGLFLLGLEAKEKLNIGEEAGQSVLKESITCEAFIVLKNDEIRYMADMEVLFFGDDIVQKLISLQDDYKSAAQSLTLEKLQNNPKWDTKLKSLDTLRDKISEKKIVLEKQVRLEIIRSIEGDIDDLNLELEKGGKAWADLKETSREFDLYLSQKRRELSNLNYAENIAKLERKALEAVNQHIISQGLYVYTLRDQKGILDTEVVENESTNINYGGKKPAGFILDYFSHERGKASWKCLTKIPEECQDDNLYSLLKDLVNQKEGYDILWNNLNDTIKANSEKRSILLIPWENKYNLDQKVFTSKFELLFDIRERKRKTISSLESSDKQNIALTRAVQDIENEIAEQHDNIAQEENNILREALSDILTLYHKKFTSLLEKHSKFSLRTGSNGDFSIPKGMNYLYAARHRDSGESVFWFLKIKPILNRFNLSNSNALILNNEEECISWMFNNFSL